MIKKLFLATVNILLGLTLGVLILEGVLHGNPGLLFRGMPFPAPFDPPLTRNLYEVRYSDGDVFLWRPDLVRPLSAEEDHLEASVEFVTDEFGFRNQSGQSIHSDIVVAGSSVSLGANVASPWPERLARISGLKVLNLSQAGPNLAVKMRFIDKYGLVHKPEWVIIEVIPSIEIVGSYRETSNLIVRNLVFPLTQSLVNRQKTAKVVGINSKPIYPITLNLPGRSTEFTCCIHYLEFFTLDSERLKKSYDWEVFSRDLIKAINDLQSKSTCVALLVVPTKPVVYFPLAEDPAQLVPTLREISQLGMDADGRVVKVSMAKPQVETIQRNAFVGRDLLLSLAEEHNLPIIDPTQAMVDAVTKGNDPFLVYDAHWNDYGHDLVAKEALQMLKNTSCQ